MFGEANGFMLGLGVWALAIVIVAIVIVAAMG